MQQRFRIAVEASGATVLVAPIGEVDIATVDQLDDRLDALRADFARVVLDLRQVTFVDSTGLHLMLRVDAAARSDGWDFQIIDGPAGVRRLFELTQVTQRLRFIEPDGRPEPQ